MNKHLNFIFPLLIIASIMCVSHRTTVSPPKLTEIKPDHGFRQGLWVRAASTASPEAISRIVGVVKEMEITDVFVQVVVGGYAYYNSNLLPRSQYLSKTSGQHFDPLDSLIQAFSDSPVRIHAWVNALLYWSLPEPPESLNHIYYLHPDWFICDVNGVSMVNYPYQQWKNMNLEGLYLDPQNPEVVSFVQQVCAEIVLRYPVDGLHLDFIRYPGILWGLPDRDEAAVLASIDAHDVQWCNLVRYPQLNLIQRWLVWRTWRLTRDRQQAIAQIVDLTAEEVVSHALKDGCQFSAAVFANPALFRYSFAQDWTEWRSDIFLPVVMSYTPDIALFTDYMNFATTHRPDALMGIGFLWPEMEGMAPRQVNATRKAAGAGVCFFDFAYLDTTTRKAPWRYSEPVEDGADAADRQYETVTNAFADSPPSAMVEKGRRLIMWGSDLSFAAYLISLSLDPMRDLERLGLRRGDFVDRVAQDAAAFQYLDQQIFPIGEDLFEPPKRSVRYHHLAWTLDDSLAVMQQAKNIQNLEQSAAFYPKAGDPFVRAVFQAPLGSRELLQVRSGIYVFTVDSIQSAGKSVKRKDLSFELCPVFVNWTIMDKAMTVLNNND